MSPDCQQHHDEDQVCDERTNGLSSLRLNDSDLHEWEVRTIPTESDRSSVQYIHRNCWHIQTAPCMPAAIDFRSRTAGQLVLLCLRLVQKQKSDAHVDLAAYDHATLALTAALFGHEGGARLSEMPVLPVAPWNQRPGYLVSFRLALSAITLESGPCLCTHMPTICSSPGAQTCMSPHLRHLCNARQGHLTPEQEQKLQAMRESFPESTAWHNDHDLLRFLRARGGNLEAARMMYSKYCVVVSSRKRIFGLSRTEHPHPCHLQSHAAQDVVQLGDSQADFATCNLSVHAR